MHPATDSSKENRHETEIIARPGTLFYCCASLSGQLSLIHISEPTRPRLISYAVFCLKKFFFNDTATTEIYTV